MTGRRQADRDVPTRWATIATETRRRTEEARGASEGRQTQERNDRTRERLFGATPPGAPETGQLLPATWTRTNRTRRWSKTLKPAGGVETRPRTTWGTKRTETARRRRRSLRGSRAERSEGLAVSNGRVGASRARRMRTGDGSRARAWKHHRNERPATCPDPSPAQAGPSTGPRTERAHRLAGGPPRGSSWTRPPCERRRSSPERVPSGPRGAPRPDSPSRERLRTNVPSGASGRSGPHPEVEPSLARGDGRCRRHETRRCHESAVDRATERWRRTRHGRRAISDACAGPGGNARRRRRRSGRGVALGADEARLARAERSTHPERSEPGRGQARERSSDRALPDQPPEADMARKGRRTPGRTAGGEQAAVMRYGYRRGENLCRVRHRENHAPDPIGRPSSPTVRTPEPQGSTRLTDPATGAGDRVDARRRATTARTIDARPTR